MDLKKLIAKMDQIESKKVLTESETKEACWTDMKGKPAKGKDKKYGNQSKPTEVDNEGKEKKKVEEGLRIARALLEAFGLDEAVAGNPWEGSDPAKAAAWAALTPEDQQWLGGADPTDQYILARAPNKGAKASAAAQPTAASSQTKPAAQSDADTNPYASSNVTPDVAAGMRAANASATTGTPGAAGQPTPSAAKPAPKVQASTQKPPQSGAGAIGAQAALRKADAAATTSATRGADLTATRKRMQELLAKANAR